MRCLHNQEGCSWEGETSLLVSHLETCEFDLKDCPADCGHKVSCAVLQEHLNARCKTKCSKRCEYCGAIFTIESETTHIATCIQLPIPCPHNCFVGCVPRGQLDEHLNQDCEMNIQPCPFNDVGCKYEAAKSKSTEHLKDNLDTHLFKLNTYVHQTNNQQMEENKKIKAESDRLNTKLTQTVSGQNEENRRIKAENRRLNTAFTRLTQTINQQKEENRRIKTENQRLSTNFTYLTETVSQLIQENKTTRVENERLNTGFIGLKLQINQQKGENEKIKSENKSFDTTFTRLTQNINQQKDENKRIKTENQRLSQSFTRLTGTVNQLIQENRTTKAENERVNTRLTETINQLMEKNKKSEAENVRLHTSFNELKLNASQQVLTNKQLTDEIEMMKNENEVTWTVEDFAAKMRKSKNRNGEELNSTSFYSHRNGYKMRLKLFMNGCGAGKSSHVSLFLQMIKGEFDDLLEWPFTPSVFITLLDQNSDPNEAVNVERTFHLIATDGMQKPKSEYGGNMGWQEFISHEILYRKNYINCDKIVIKAKVTKNLSKISLNSASSCEAGNACLLQ